MTGNEGDVYVRIIHRVALTILVLGVAGTLALMVAQGWRFALGFFLGACVSYGSFWRWQAVVESIGETTQQRSSGFMVIRFLLLAAVAYGIVKYLDVTAVAVLLGLLTSAAAVIISIVFELFYART